MCKNKNLNNFVKKNNCMYLVHSMKNDRNLLQKSKYFLIKKILSYTKTKWKKIDENI